MAPGRLSLRCMPGAPAPRPSLGPFADSPAPGTPTPRGPHEDGPVEGRGPKLADVERMRHKENRMSTVTPLPEIPRATQPSVAIPELLDYLRAHSGLEFLQAVADGQLPAPPIGEL